MKEDAQQEDIILSNPIFQSHQENVENRKWHPLHENHSRTSASLMLCSKSLGDNKPDVNDAETIQKP